MLSEMNIQRLPKGFQLVEFAPDATGAAAEKLRSLLDGMTISYSSSAIAQVVQLEAVLRRMATFASQNTTPENQDEMDESVMMLLEKVRSLREWRLSFTHSTT